MKGHIYFIPITPKRKKNKNKLTALKLIQHALPLCGCCYMRGTTTLNNQSRHYFFSVFQKAWGLSAAVHWETLPPKVYSNSTRQRAGCRAEEGGKNTQGKVWRKKKKVQIKTRKILQPPVATGTGATLRGEFTCLPSKSVQRADGKHGPDQIQTRTSRTKKLRRNKNMKLKLIFNYTIWTTTSWLMHSFLLVIL